MQRPAKPTEDNLGLVLRDFCRQWRSPFRVVPLGIQETRVLLLLDCQSSVKSYSWGHLQVSLHTGIAGASSQGQASSKDMQVLNIGNESIPTRSKWAKKW